MSHLEEVRAARTGLEAGMERLRAAALREAEAWAAELVVREDWRRVYRAVYGELIARFPGDRRRVESFFRAVCRSRAPDEEAEAGAGEELTPEASAAAQPTPPTA